MIAVLNTRLANAASVMNALERLERPAQLTRNPDELRKASHVILPGVGTANALMHDLCQEGLLDCISRLTQPVLGICLGMQVLYEFSEEGQTQCLGLFPGKVKRMKPDGKLPIPHMGWNRVESAELAPNPSLLLKGISPGSYFYFVHSFHAPEGPETKAWSEYGGRVPAVIEKGNLFGIQFHPERSGVVGEALLRNFSKL